MMNNGNGFQWIDGQPMSATWSNWKKGEPNNMPSKDVTGGEDCVVMGWVYSKDELFQWRDVKCNIISRYICQRAIASKYKL